MSIQRAEELIRAKGSRIIPADNPKSKTRGVLDTATSELIELTLEEFSSSEFLLAWRKCFFTKTDAREAIYAEISKRLAERPSSGVIDFSMTQHYYHFDD